MRFFIISDMHFDANFDNSKAKMMLKDLCSKIRSEIPLEPLLFILLGDIINAGDVSGFETARNCLELIKAELKDYTIHFDFVPGNHDAPMGNIKHFDRFISEFGIKHSFESSGAYSKIYDGINFIFADSIRHRDHAKPGMLDMDAIKSKVMPNMQNILFCHHAFAQSHGGTHDSIEDSASCLKTLSQMSIDFVFHGHTHQADEAFSAGNIIEIGCGSLFRRDSWLADNEIQNQFTVVGTRDCKIVEIGRYLISRDGANIFPYSSLYPENKTFIDPEFANKNKYDPIPYIPRKVFIHSYSMYDAFSQAWYRDKGCSLHEALIQEHNVLLLSEAGMGKSIEINNLAYELYLSPLFPFLYNLRNYTGKEITELLPNEYNKLAPHRRALLFDGYDELPDSLRRIFENNINSYVNDNPQCYVVISTRRNFCRINNNNESNIFPRFKAYALLGLTHNDIENYLEGESVSISDFKYKAEGARLSDLLQTPFYLIELVRLYKKHGLLPQKSSLMSELIKDSFNIDDQKFSGEIGDRYNELYTLLQKLAFSMQLMRKSRLDDYTEYQKLLVNKVDRDLLRQCGLLQMVGSSWSFCHNNFREYLVAEYMSNLPEDEVKSYVSNEEGIYPSWLNTLGFLTSVDIDWDIIGWLTEFCPEALVKSESDKVNPKLRFEIFKKIFLKHEKDGLWFESEYCTEDELAFFSQSNDSLTFLINRIEHPVNIRTQHTAINILRHFPSGLYGRKEEVLSCLVNCCMRYPETSGNSFRIALFAIAQLNLNTPEITKEIIEKFYACENDYVRLGMYEYLIKVNEHDKYVQFFLDGINYLDDSLTDNRIGNEHYMLEEGLKKLSVSESITTALKWYRKKKRKGFYGEDKVMASLLDTAACLFLHGEKILFDEVFDCYLDTQKNLDFEFTKLFASFFKKTGTEKQASLLAANNYSEDEDSSLCIVHLQPNFMRYILDAYVCGEFNDHEKFKSIVLSVATQDIYKECNDAYNKRTGLFIPPMLVKPDYEGLRNKGNQEYFDSLFSKEVFEDLFNSLIDKIGNPSVKICDLLEIHHGIEELHSAWYLLKIAIYHNGNPKSPLSSFFHEVNYDTFFVHQWKKMIKSDSKLIVTDEQKSKIHNSVYKHFEKGVLKQGITHEDRKTTITLLCHDLIFLSQYFDIKLPETIYLALTEAPVLCFGEKHTANDKYQYLSKHISKSQILERLSENIKAGCIGSGILRDHIEFCAEVKSNIAVDAALTMCKSPCDDTWIRDSALSYLYTLYGGEYISQTIIPNADGEFLLDIARLCTNIPDNDLIYAMEREYIKKPSLGLLEALLQRRNKLAFAAYVEMVEKLRHPPEYENEHVYHPTKAFTVIADVEALALLGRLMDVVFSPDFKDNSFHTLRSSLRDTLINCGKKAPEDAVALLEKYRAKAETDKDKLFCTYAIKEILNNKKRIEDAPLKIKEIKQLLF